MYGFTHYKLPILTMLYIKSVFKKGFEPSYEAMLFVLVNSSFDFAIFTCFFFYQMHGKGNCETLVLGKSSLILCVQY